MDEREHLRYNLSEILKKKCRMGLEKRVFSIFGRKGLAG
jgi:hypothetical protein